MSLVSKPTKRKGVKTREGTALTNNKADLTCSINRNEVVAKKCFNGNVKSSSFYNCEWTLVTEAHVRKPARQERQTLLPGPRPLQTWPVSHCAVLCFWRGVHPPTIAPDAGLLPSTSENLNHHWSRSPSVGRVLGNRRKNEQRFPNLPLHLFWPSVGGVIKKTAQSTTPA